MGLWCDEDDGDEGEGTSLIVIAVIVVVVLPGCTYVLGEGLWTADEPGDEKTEVEDGENKAFDGVDGEVVCDVAKMVFSGVDMGGRLGHGCRDEDDFGGVGGGSFTGTRNGKDGGFADIVQSSGRRSSGCLSDIVAPFFDFLCCRVMAEECRRKENP